MSLPLQLLAIAFRRRAIARFLIDVGGQLRRRAERLDQAVRQAEADSVREALAIARALSSGTASRRTLRQMGHPYARRHGSARMDPAVINAQTGSFRAGWQIVPPRKSPKGYVTRLQNVSAHAPFMKGTRRMVPRPIERRIRDLLKSARRSIFARHLRRALRD